MLTWHNLDHSGYDEEWGVVSLHSDHLFTHIDPTFRAKYPLATVGHLLGTLPSNLGLGYDIACSFLGTLMRSSLSLKAQALGLRMVVPAFHGHAHNRLCQLSHHILMSDGFGLEDLETCEHVFSGSNAVACLTRHATSFHRHQFIDMYFQQWDADKYASLGVIFVMAYTIAY